MAGLQVNPTQLHFRAAAGADSPVTLTLFNPHPVERVAFKIKTTASSTYRVWPNSGALEAGETARVQVLLLGTKVDLADPQRVEECRRDRFQVQFMPLAEGQAFDNSLFKLFAGLVRDIKMGVSVDIVDSTEAATGQPAGEETSPWEGMVRIALMRMMADEEREHAHNAACLTKFAELLVLNGIITTEQMWAAFNLVGDMYHTPGEGQKVMSKVEQWLEHPDFLNVVDPDAASERSSSEAYSQRSGELHTLDTPHEREEAIPTSRRDEDPLTGEESYPTSPFSGTTPAAADGGQRQSAFGAADGGEVSAAAAEQAAGLQRTLTAPGSAQGFGSVRSSLARSVSVSDAEDVSLGASEDRGDLQEVSRLAGAAAAAAAAAGHAPGGIPAAGSAPPGGEDGSGGGSSGSEDSLAAGMAEARALAAAGGAAAAANGTEPAVTAPAAADLPPAHVQPGAPVTRRVSATFAAAREAAIAAAAVTEQQQQKGSSRTVTPVRVTLQERKAKLAEQADQPDPLLQAALAEDLDEAFAPDMLAEARAQMAAASSAMAATAVVPPTGPHMLSFADRAAMYGSFRNGSGAGSGPPATGGNGAAHAGGAATANGALQSGSFSESSREYVRRSGGRSGGPSPRPTNAAGAVIPAPYAAATGGGAQFQRRSDHDRARILRQAAAGGAFGRQSGNSAGLSRDSARDSHFGRDAGRDREAGLRQDSARDQGYGRDSGRDSTREYGRDSGHAREHSRDSTLYQRDSGYARDSGLRQSSGYATPAGAYARDSAPYSASPVAAAAVNYPADAAAYIREAGGYGRESSGYGGRGSGASHARPVNGPESRPSFESPRPAELPTNLDSARALDSARDSHLSAGVPTSAGGGNVPISGGRNRSSRRSSAEGDLRRRYSSDEPSPGALTGTATTGPPSRMRPGTSGELSSQPSGQQSGLDRVSPRGGPLAAGGSGIAGSPAQSTPRSNVSEGLGPAVRVLLPGKQSLTRGELAAATSALQGGEPAGLRANSASASRPASARRSTSFGGGGGGAGAGQVAPDSEAPSTAGETPRSPQQTPRADEFERSAPAGPAPAVPVVAAAPGGATGSPVRPGPGQRKKGGFLKKLGDAISTRAEAAARNAAGGSGYYYV